MHRPFGERGYCPRCGALYFGTHYCMPIQHSGEYRVTYSNPPSQMPFLCPVCNGTGLVSRPPGTPGDVPIVSTSGTPTYPCRVCSGEGVVWGPPLPKEKEGEDK